MDALVSFPDTRRARVTSRFNATVMPKNRSALSAAWQWLGGRSRA